MEGSNHYRNSYLLGVIHSPPGSVVLPHPEDVPLQSKTCGLFIALFLVPVIVSIGNRLWSTQRSAGNE